MNHKVQTIEKNFDDIKQALLYMHIYMCMCVYVYVYTHTYINVLLTNKYITLKCK